MIFAAKNKTLIILVGALLIFGPSFLEAAPLKVATTILPVSDLVKEIAGENISVMTILAPDANPHTFELTPQLIKELDGSLVIFRIGKGFDDWLAHISDHLSAIPVVTLDEGIQTLNQDPHYWLSMKNAKIMVAHIAGTLIRLDPMNQGKYQNNLNRYLRDLDAAHQQIQDKLSPLTQRKIITFHDGWRYFAQDYGLDLVATIEPSQGGQATPKRLAKLHKIIRRHQIRVLFTEPAVPKTFADSIAHDFDLAVVQLDPFGMKNENRTFIGLMLDNADEIARALKTNG